MTVRTLRCKRAATLVALLAAWVIAASTGFAAAPADDLLAALRGGGHVLLIRHAQTEPGLGDPPGMRLDDCRTQRNLSGAGREQARRLGDALRGGAIPVAEVRSSQWCRCLETARLAFGDHVAVDAWPALNSFFGDAAAEPVRTRELRAAASRVSGAANVVWVTHQVNITGLTGIVPAPGEVVIVRSTASGLVVAGRWTPG